jgi:hypothetical protein
MPVRTAYATDLPADQVAGALREQLPGPGPKVLMYFSSPKFDPEALAHSVGQAFDGSAVFGCTTAGEIVSGQMLKGSVVAMGLDEDIIDDVAVEVVEGISGEDSVGDAFNRLGAHFGESMSSMSPETYVGIVLFDGLRGAEERLMERMGDRTDVTFIGASAGDDVKFELTHVFANGEAYTDAAVLAVLKPAVKFDFLKVQSLCPTGKKLVTTRVDEEHRTVLEFDGRPAVAAYAQTLGVPSGEVSDHFMTNPVGLMIDGEPFVRSPQHTEGDSIVFYCNIKEGMELDLLEATDIVSDTKAALDAKLKELPDISGIVNFHCILRTLELDAKGQSDAYGKLFEGIPTVGFSTYGEEYIGHMNQTSTMLLFR